jgi:hypothetical protein
LLIRNKQKYRPPTLEEFLQFKPKRLDFKWTEDESGLVTISVPKFESKIGKSFCKTVRKDNLFEANMDKLGSIVWKNSDGKKTVKQILKILEKEFPKEKGLDQRLIMYIQQLGNLNYLDY